ncbi:cobyric acid synthase [Rudaeicoccus suwonensis]|uniref:Cobyric acid synthase n=1 Tax=Rudaeicoccus suwonensis TaxID=657409 RepID=A0A561E7X4_9MICO|nr:cobyric acid synthase [Rudaeicoccus suwonensis]TWE11712.1 adenosylcobyric acid synthase (glutamine-hydrolysing) [Rudaeicoccus suwonensis]
MPGLLIAGTGSDAGKSLVTTGLVRAWSRRGVRVAPFKAQNMSNNSMVCADGGEIGRAQYLQALAAGVEPCTLHNPVLLKPGSDRRAHVVLRGQPAGELHAGEYATDRRLLRDTAFEAYDELAASVDLVVAEGAGSPTEINLRAGDFVNLGLARRFGLPVAVVGDIDRGGILAALYGTWALLDDQQDRDLLKAFIINKFRGDEAILQPGLDMVTERTGVPFAGVLPWLEEVWIDSEDTLAVGGWREHDLEASLRIAVIRLPRTSNATDVDALAAEPGVSVRVTTDAQVCRDADLLVLPGSRATVADLSWLRSRGLDSVVTERAARGLPVLGICGGYQMLVEAIDDPVESGDGHVRGLGILPGTVHFTPDKVLGRPSAVWRGTEVHGYEIHHGRVDDDGSFPGGVRRGAVDGTIWHGIFECDAFRRLFLADVARRTGSTWQVDATAPDFDARRRAMIETIADAMERHLDLDLLLRLAQVSGSGRP